MHCGTDLKCSKDENYVAKDNMHRFNLISRAGALPDAYPKPNPHNTNHESHCLDATMQMEPLQKHNILFNTYINILFAKPGNIYDCH